MMTGTIRRCEEGGALLVEVPPFARASDEAAGTVEIELDRDMAAVAAAPGSSAARAVTWANCHAAIHPDCAFYRARSHAEKNWNFRAKTSNPHTGRGRY